MLEELEDYQIIGKAGKIIRLMRVQNIKSLELFFLESLFKGDENPKSVQTFSSLCRPSIPDLHPEPGLQGAGLTPSHYQ